MGGWARVWDGMERLKGLIDVALGRRPPELLIRDAKIINTYTLEVEEGNIAIWQGLIVGIGDYEEGEKIIDAKGLFVAPSFIDSHIHLESTHLTPGEFARVIVPRGTGAVIADPHEIANVLGLEGIRFMIESSRGLPLDIFYMIPSCVPASPFESSGAELGPEEVQKILGWEGVLGLGELMNYPGLLAKDELVLRKLLVADDRPIDGHAPRLTGRELNAYIAAGPSTDHETTAPKVALGKIRRGIVVQIREGSSEHNLKDLVPLVNGRNLSRFMFASDDRSPLDLLRQGHLDHILREAVAAGRAPQKALRLATRHPPEHYHLERLGAIAPGRWANLVLLSDLKNFEAQMVLYRGKVVAEEGRPLFATSLVEDEMVRGTVRIRLRPEDLIIPAEEAERPVIELVPGQVVTERSAARPRVEGDEAVPDLEGDVLKLVLVERHRGSGRVGRAFVRGFGIERGALASSIAHDAHNIIAVGVTDQDIYRAIERVAELGGGLVATLDERILAELPLPLAGLLSDRSATEVAAALLRLHQAARELGSIMEDPYAPLSFLALSVIPRLRLSDRGLLNVERFELIG
ncbi:MAG: adenine deaminase [Candidatus Bipolaricaulia bacterium]